MGNVGPTLWQWVRGSSEPDPIDRYTRRAVTSLAARFDAEALFPFGGPPWHPFQRWAIRAEALERSPLGVLIHPEYGLWHAYRAALLFREAVEVPEPAPAAGPCSRCLDRPVPQGLPGRSGQRARLQRGGVPGPSRQPSGRLMLAGLHRPARLPGRPG